jgi:uncharacterized protein
VSTVPALGLGIGWRPELASFIDQRTAAPDARAGGEAALGFVEVIAESLHPGAGLPAPLARLRERGLAVIPHGVKLSLGGAEPPDAARLAHLADRALALEAPLVSEHVAFVRAGGLEAGHLLPVPRTRDALAVLVDNVRQAEAALPVPLALEHIAALAEWPDTELDEAEFLTELLERTSALLLVDVANLHAGARNHGLDPAWFLDRLPLDRLAYVHVAGGIERDGLYHDTHAHPVPPAVLDILEDLVARVSPPGVLLERDDDYPPAAELAGELAAIASALRRGVARRASPTQTRP